ncbi:MAG: PEP-CTERM sorting domain-containing protein, partial [Thiobacillus sp.]|nr:PEP-CTERM sorting domain-containing protein [Thiobacillus sp.]
QPAAPPSAAPPGAGTPLPAANLPPETTGLPLADPLPGNPPVTGLPDAPLFQPALLPQAQTAANSVPEPGSLMLLAFGGMVLWWMRRPRGRQAVVTPAAC